MSELRLRAGVQFAPAGYPFVDPRTGYKVDAYERSIVGAVDMLIAHRKANERIYSPSEPQWFSPSLVKQEVLRHLFDKAPHIFAGPVAAPVARAASGAPEKCSCGGTSFSVNYCKTCGSGMVPMGWICDSCKKIISA